MAAARRAGGTRAGGTAADVGVGGRGGERGTGEERREEGHTRERCPPTTTIGTSCKKEATGEAGRRRHLPAVGVEGEGRRRMSRQRKRE